MVLWRAGAEPRLWVVELDQMVARINTGDEVCGGRGSAMLEFLAGVFGRRRWWWLRVREDTLSTVVRSVAALGDGGHGGDMAGRR